MIFLGLAANYSAGGAFRHLFARGNAQDSERLREFLAKKYSTSERKIEKNRVALYQNGRSALSVAVKTLVPQGSEVVVNGFTCVAVTQAVKEAKSRPVFADINPETLHFDAGTLEKCLKRHPDARALIIQNTFGNPVNIAEIEKIAKKHGLVIIEDLAHTVSARYPDGRLVGTVGDAVVFSFGKGKAVDTITGGALILRSGGKTPYQPVEKSRFSDRFRARIYPLLGLMTRGLYHVGLGKAFMSGLVKTHFVERSADADTDGYVRLSHWQAKLALIQFEMLDLLPVEAPLRYFYLVEDRADVLDKLEKNGCHLREFWYEKPVAPARYYKRQNFPEAECPEAVKTCERIVNVPTFYSFEALKPALAIIRGEDPNAEERARRAEKIAKQAEKMAKRAEAMSERAKSAAEGEDTEKLTAKVAQLAETAKRARAEADARKAEKEAKTGETPPEKATKTAKKAKKSRREQPVETEGGVKAGFKASEIDFVELFNEENRGGTESESTHSVVAKVKNSEKTSRNGRKSSQNPEKVANPPQNIAKLPKVTENPAKNGDSEQNYGETGTENLPQTPKISNKTTRKMLENAEKLPKNSQNSQNPLENSAKSAKFAKITVARRLLKNPKKVEIRPERVKKVLKNAGKTGSGPKVTRSNAVLKSKEATEKPIKVAKNEFFEQKGKR